MLGAFLCKGGGCSTKDECDEEQRDGETKAPMGSDGEDVFTSRGAAFALQVSIAV